MKFSIVAFFSFLFGACQPATEGLRVIPAKEFAEFIMQTDVQILDVRTLEEFDAGHIHGAMMIDYRTDPDGFLVRAEALLQKDKPVALYCRSGMRSHAAAELMLKNGFKRIVELDGGIIAWQEAEMRIDTE